MAVSHWLSIFLLLAALVAPAPARAQDSTRTPLTDAQKVYGLSMIWKEADYNFPLFKRLPALNWDSAYQAFIPQVLQSSTTIDYYHELIRFTALLQDGHTQVTMPPRVLQQHVFDQPDVRVTAVAGHAIVWNVEDTLAAHIPVGSEIIAVNGVPTSQYLAREVYPYIGAPARRFREELAMVGWYVNGVGLLWGQAGTRVAVTVRTPAGEERSVSLIRDGGTRRAEWAREFPSGAPFSFRWLGDKVAYVALNTFSAWASEADRFDSVAPQLEQASGLVLDVRQNGGGNNSVGRQIIARYLTSDTLLGSRWRARINNGAFRAWGRYLGQEWARDYWPYYTGDAWYDAPPEPVAPDTAFPKLTVPIVLLIGRNTGSAAEDFVIWLDGAKNVTLVGEPTTGSTGQTIEIDLPGGGTARILAKHDTYADGREFVGIGIQPDVLVERTVDDVVHDRDAVLARALEVLRGHVH
jgi:carboxyl-terminal processing protease